MHTNNANDIDVFGMGDTKDDIKVSRRQMTSISNVRQNYKILLFI